MMAVDIIGGLSSSYYRVCVWSTGSGSSTLQKLQNTKAETDTTKLSKYIFRMNVYTYKYIFYNLTFENAFLNICEFTVKVF